MLIMFRNEIEYSPVPLAVDLPMTKSTNVLLTQCRDGIRHTILGFNLHSGIDNLARFIDYEVAALIPQ